MVTPYVDRPKPVGTGSVHYQYPPTLGGTADVYSPTSPAFGNTDIAGDLIWNVARRQARVSFDPRQRFLALADEWHAATDSLSSSSEIAMHPAYQRIIGMGMVAVPFILQDLRQHGGQWYWALRAIVGHAPYAREDAGNVKRMKTAWLDWGRAHKLI